jgi:hypothetical protein
MGVRTTSVEGKVAMFDSTTGMAFGPVFDSTGEADSYMLFAAQKFPGKDIRELYVAELINLHVMWMNA